MRVTPGSCARSRHGVDGLATGAQQGGRFIDGQQGWQIVQRHDRASLEWIRLFARATSRPPRPWRLGGARVVHACSRAFHCQVCWTGSMRKHDTARRQVDAFSHV